MKKKLIGILVIAGLLVFGYFQIKSSFVYRKAVAAAKIHPKVIAVLGQPIEEGGLFTGSFSFGSSGHAELEIPLKGPSGSGKLYVAATKQAGQWQADALEFYVSGHQEGIDLLQALPLSN
jgi:hypothetical protein